jgi:hypothetical protein
VTGPLTFLVAVRLLLDGINGFIRWLSRFLRGLGRFHDFDGIFGQRRLIAVNLLRSEPFLGLFFLYRLLVGIGGLLLLLLLVLALLGTQVVSGGLILVSISCNQFRP